MITASGLLLTVFLGGCATYPQYTYGYGSGYYEGYPGTYWYGYSPRFPYDYYRGYASGAGGGNG